MHNSHQPRSEDMDDANRARRLATRRRLKSVRTGLLVALVAVPLIALLFIGQVLVFLFLEDRAEERAASYLAVGAVAANVLGVAGRLLCLPVPAQSRTRPIIAGTVALEAVSLVLNVGSFLVEIPRLIANLWTLASLGALALFVFFLFRLSVYLKLNEPAQEAEDLLGWGVWLVIFVVVIDYVLPTIPFLGGIIAMLLSLAMMVMVIVMIVRYVQLLWWIQLELGWKLDKRMA